MIGYISRTEHFSAAHRLHSPHLTDEDNRQIFGKCNHKNGHGHNYVLEVILRGEIDPTTGMVVNSTDLKQWIKVAILDILDHRNLDMDVAYFKENASTTENLAVFSWIRLSQNMPRNLLYKIIIAETPKNKVIFKGEGLTDQELQMAVI